MIFTDTVDRADTNYKRLLYVRYADDFVILVTGYYQDTLRIRNVLDLIKHTDKSTISPTTEPFIFLGGGPCVEELRTVINCLVARELILERELSQEWELIYLLMYWFIN